jgi:16S rRNA processing protein RimM
LFVRQRHPLANAHTQEGAVMLEVGRVEKAHGLKGEVVVSLVTDRTERLAPGTVLGTRTGDLVVRSSKPYQHRWLVTFEGVDDRTAAERLHGLALLAEPIEDPEAIWVHDLVGTTVRDLGGTERGTVVAVLANPAHDLLELDTGHLVPMPFVVGCEGGVTTIDPPDGLFD